MPPSSSGTDDASPPFCEQTGGRRLHIQEVIIHMTKRGLQQSKLLPTTALLIIEDELTASVMLLNRNYSRAASWKKCLSPTLFILSGKVCDYGAAKQPCYQG